MLSRTGFRVKFQEAGGLQLKNCFSTDLSRGDHCGREICPPCEQETENRQNCRTQNILYETKCLLCNPPTSGHKKDAPQKPAIRNGIYYGESSRSFQERIAEHVKDADTFSQKSHVIKHWMKDHRDENTKPPFAYKVIKKYKDCLSRQVGEAIKIQQTKDNILNSKCEYLSNNISRLTVMEDDWERKRRERAEEEVEEKEKLELEKFRVEKTKGLQESLKVSIQEEEFNLNDEDTLLSENPEMFRKAAPRRPRENEEIEERNGKRLRLDSNMIDVVEIADKDIPEYVQEEKAEVVSDQEAGPEVSHRVMKHFKNDRLKMRMQQGQKAGKIKVKKPSKNDGKKLKPSQKDGTKAKMKQDQKAGNKTRGPNIAYWLPWWNRMEREAERLREELKRNRISNYLDPRIPVSCPRVACSYGNYDKVDTECHPRDGTVLVKTTKSSSSYDKTESGQVTREHPPRAVPTSVSKHQSTSKGRKRGRIFDFALESPAKRNIFDDTECMNLSPGGQGVQADNCCETKLGEKVESLT